MAAEPEHDRADVVRRLAEVVQAGDVRPDPIGASQAVCELEAQP
jgi:hypothetical protein